MSEPSATAQWIRDSDLSIAEGIGLARCRGEQALARSRSSGGARVSRPLPRAALARPFVASLGWPVESGSHNPPKPRFKLLSRSIWLVPSPTHLPGPPSRCPDITTAPLLFAALALSLPSPPNRPPPATSPGATSTPTVSWTSSSSSTALPASTTTQVVVASPKRIAFPRRCGRTSKSAATTCTPRPSGSRESAASVTSEPSSDRGRRRTTSRERQRRDLPPAMRPGDLPLRGNRSPQSSNKV